MPALYKDIFLDPKSTLRAEINPYVADLWKNRKESSNALLFGQDLLGSKGAWRKIFRDSMEKKPRSLVLEIGTHNGSTLCELAEAHTEIAFVGMDITFKRVVSTARKIQSRGLKNALCVLGDARQIDRIFAPSELDGVMAFFPDPWEKKQGQIHHRLFSSEYCKKTAKLIAGDGFFWFRTDSRDYHDSIAASLRGEYFLLKPADLPSQIKVKPGQSCFGRRFEELGKMTHGGIWSRVKARA